MWLVVLLVVAAGAFFLISKNKKAVNKCGAHKHARAAVSSSSALKNTGSQRTTANPANQYHAISICCEDHACAAALANQKKRYLVAEVPQLPLAGCAAETCNCRYEHHPDRRDDEGDRRLTFGLSQDLHGVANEDKREKRDRRKSR